MIVFGDKCFNAASFLIVVCAQPYIAIGSEKINTAAKYIGYESSDAANAQIWQIIIKTMYFAVPLAKVLISNLSSLQPDSTIKRQNLTVIFASKSFWGSSVKFAIAEQIK